MVGKVKIVNRELAESLSSKKVKIGVAVFLFIVVAVLGGVLLYSSAREKPKVAKKKIVKKVVKKKLPPPPPPPTCPVCGLETTAENAKRRPLGIMVENMSTVRPQTGMDKACAVVEALAEGGITRFLLIYVHQDAAEIGPVRSARAYYVEIAHGFQALYAHCGFSAYAVDALQELGKADLDQFRYEKAYWRAKGHKAPHNLFTSTDRIWTAGETAGNEKEVAYIGFSHQKDASMTARPEGQTITIDFSSPGYRVEYRYDRQSNSYLRFNGGKAHLDSVTGLQLSPKNVVVMRAETYQLPGKDGCLKIGVIGQGECLVFSNGTAIKGTWQKASADDQLIFKDEAGAEILFSPGQLWIELVKPDTPVNYQTIVPTSAIPTPSTGR